MIKILNNSFLKIKKLIITRRFQLIILILIKIKLIFLFFIYIIMINCLLLFFLMQIICFILLI